MKKLRVAIVGTGYFSTFHFDAWSRCPEVEIVAVAGLDDDRVSEVSALYDIPAIYRSADDMVREVDVDLMDIVTPPNTHLDLISLAGRHGVDVICQKPFCGNLSSAKQAVETAKKADIKLVVHENFRFQPWYAAIKSELNSNRLGRIYRASFRLRPGDGKGADAYLERQPYFREMPRFLVHETVIHYIDVMRYLFGEVRTVNADLVRLNPSIAGEDSGLVILGLDDGLRVVIDGNRLSDHKAENRRRTMGDMLIEGEHGCLTLNGDGEVYFRAHGQNNSEAISFEWNDHGFGGDCVYLFTRHVVDHFLNDSELSNAASDYLINLAVEDAVYESASDGCRLDLTVSVH